LRRRVGLHYRFFPKRSVKAPDVVAFLRQLLRHLPRGFVVLWDRGTQHRAAATKEFLRAHSRVSVEYLPAYAPELNPDEHFWALLKNHRMANHGYPDLRTLHKRVAYHAARVRKRPDLIWGCIRASELRV
jgi:transposase